MAIVTSMWMTGSKKKLGGTVLYKAMGQTRQRWLASEIANPRTESQMTQRVKWANLVNFYRANRSWMKYAFETKKPNQSEYNKLMSLNVSTSRIFLTKQQAANGSCVLAPYIVTQGSLPSIETTTSEAYVTTNIYTGMRTFDFDDMSVAEFSQGVVENNPALQYGDQLSIIVMTQQTNGDTGFPFIIVRKYELILSRDNQAQVSDYWPIDRLDIVTNAEVQPLRFRTFSEAGAVVFVVSRTISGKTYVSSQSLVLYGMDNFVAYYSSADQLADAIASYGQSEDAFLASTYAARDPNQITPWSIIGLQIGTTRYPIGSRVAPFGNHAGQAISVELSGAPGSSGVSLALQFIKGGQVEDVPVLEAIEANNVVSATLPSDIDEYDDWTLYKVVVTAGNITNEAAFRIVNADFIQGLE